MPAIKMSASMRWFGPSDPVSLSDIRQSGSQYVVTALHEIPNGELWPESAIRQRQELVKQAGLDWLVVESVPVHDAIKRQSEGFEALIDNYCQTLLNLSACGIRIVTYNFMPVLDWTRTDLSFKLSDGSKALRFERLAYIMFDLCMLERDSAEMDYSGKEIEAARLLFEKMSEGEKLKLQQNIIAGLPGSEESFSITEFKNLLANYRGVTADVLRNHLSYFLKRIVPVAKSAGISLAIHPDDPPHSLFGLPRIISSERDIEWLLNQVNDTENGLCFCTGSYGVRKDNDLPAMIRRFGDRIHFIHLRSTIRNDQGDFYEADHLEGDVDMFAVVQEIVKLMQKRKVSIPMRPDHGHQMLDDLSKKTNPGYSAIGRLRGLAELRGLELGIARSLDNF